METKRDERAAAGAGEIARDEKRTIEPLGQRLEPAREIDGGADGGEIEPVDGADIAEDDLADMNADTDAELDATVRAAQRVQASDALEALVDRDEGALRGVR